jgi:hypothetical protein
MFQEDDMIVSKVRLTVEQTKEGLRATILRRADPTDGRVARQSEAFLVESVAVAKRRASAVARQHGLTNYAFRDKTGAKD